MAAVMHSCEETPAQKNLNIELDNFEQEYTLGPCGLLSTFSHLFTLPC